MTKSQIEKFAVGYSSYPTDCVEEVLKISNFDEEKFQTTKRKHQQFGRMEQ